MAHLGGMAFGFLYLKLKFPSVSGRLPDWRGQYRQWKMQRAKKKFQVYMRKHNSDPKEYFDEYGNFRPPDDPDKKDGGNGKGGWVN